MRRKKDSFMDLLEYYFNTYLPVAKGLSEATITSYKATFRILIEFMYVVKSVPSDKVSLEILDSQVISDFLDWLEMERGCSISTRNQRLSALAAFAIYVQNRDFGSGAVFRNNISKIPKKKAPRQEASRPILDAFWSWVEATSALHTTNEMLTKALTYATNQKEYLETFMEDGRLPISNNLCEANIKPFATARRTWLFADTPKGAKANAVLYTLVESARLNELDVYTYLKYLPTEMPNNHHPQHPEIIDNYLPWSATLPQECRLNYKNKSASNYDVVSIAGYLRIYTSQLLKKDQLQ